MTNDDLTKMFETVMKAGAPVQGWSATAGGDQDTLRRSHPDRLWTRKRPDGVWTERP